MCLNLIKFCFLCGAANSCLCSCHCCWFIFLYPLGELIIAWLYFAISSNIGDQPLSVEEGGNLFFVRKCLPYNGKKTFSDPIETFKTPLFFTPHPPQVGQYFRHPRRFLLPAPSLSLSLSLPPSLPLSLPPSLPNLKVWPLNWKLYSEVMWS